MIKKFSLFAAVMVLVTLTGCGVNSNMMFKEPVKDSLGVNSDSIPMIPEGEYTIGINDKLSFTLSANNGSSIIEGIGGLGGSSQGFQQGGNSGMTDYVVRSDGSVRLPVVGKIQIEGLTVEECEDTLESIFAKEYIDPFVQVKITNRRAFLFPGSGSTATVVSLDNPNTTLLEVIAMAGGIPERGKSNSIRIMRKTENSEREIYRVDLSTMEGLKFADMIIQSNDYIYVNPRPQLAQEIQQEIVPVFSLFSTVLVIFTAVMSLK